MSLRTRWFAGLAEQLGRPSGIRGRFIGLILNRRNRTNVTVAVTALELTPGAVVADIGFGGGVGLEILLRAVGESGEVHGVDVSETMIAAGKRRFRREIAADRLRLHSSSVMRLPFGDGCLDGAITVNTIYFIDDLDGACAELGRVLKPSGRLVVGLTDPTAMAQAPYTAHGFRFRPVSEVIAALLKAGLTLETDRRVGRGAHAYHLLVTQVAGPV